MNILITGATDGIGLELARLHRQQGATLFLVGRRPLAELTSEMFTPATYCQSDLGHQESAAQVAAWLAQKGVAALDRVYLNAAMGYVGDFAAQTPQSIREMLHVNLYTPIRLVHQLMPAVEKVGGRFIVIGSVASVLPSPRYAVYSASKAALTGFVRSLQVELRAVKSPASIQIIHPGATATGMHAKSGMNADEIARIGFASAPHVARQIAQLADRQRRASTVGLVNRLAFVAGRLWPEVVEWGMRRHPPARQNSTTAGRHCVITGAANGIGEALSLRFARAGYTLSGVDLDVSRAIDVQAAVEKQGVAARFIIGDLAQPDDIERIGACLRELPPVDILIHNAGVSAVGPFLRGDLDRQMTVLDVNLLAPLLLTGNLLAGNHFSPGGLLIFISSLSHFTGYPGAAIYAASKDGLASFASSLSIALTSRDVRVMTVFPGPTRTGHARRYSPDNRRENKRMAPAVLAGLIYRAAARRQRTLIPGAGNRATALIGRVWPSLTESIMQRAVFDKLRRVPTN